MFIPQTLLQTLKEMDGVVFCDIDDVIVETIVPWVRLLVKEVGRPKGVRVTRWYLRRFVGHRLENSDHWQSKKAINFQKKLRNSIKFHRVFPAMSGAIKALWKLAELGLLGCYLTARPERMKRVTEGLLEDVSAPKRMVVLRPKDFADTKQHDWKHWLLEQCPRARALIDDNPDLVDGWPDDDKILFLFGPQKEETLEKIRRMQTAGRTNVVHVANWRIALHEIRRRFDPKFRHTKRGKEKTKQRADAPKARLSFIFSPSQVRWIFFLNFKRSTSVFFINYNVRPYIIVYGVFMAIYLQNDEISHKISVSKILLL